MSAAVPDANAPEVVVEPSFPRMRKLDAAWYRIEQWACGIFFLVMALVVFLSVVRDVFGTRHDWWDAVVLFGLVFTGSLTRVTRQGELKRGLVVNLVGSLIVTAAVGGLVELYVRLLPGGFTWGPKLALCLMLWVAFFGASMATYEKAHLSLEVGEKLWPKKAQRYAKAFAHVLTSAFCIIMLVLSIISIAGHYEAWSITDGQGDTVPSLDWLPQWAVFLIFPYLFIAIAIRISAQAVTVGMGKDIPYEGGGLT